MKTPRPKKRLLHPQKISHKQLWNLGRHYADFFAPHIVELARATNYHLPCRSHAELFLVVKDVYDLLEKEQGIPWDSLTSAKQDDFLAGFWGKLREKGILEDRRP